MIQVSISRGQKNKTKVNPSKSKERHNRSEIAKTENIQTIEGELKRKTGLCRALLDTKAPFLFLK